MTSKSQKDETPNPHARLGDGGNRSTAPARRRGEGGAVRTTAATAAGARDSLVADARDSPDQEELMLILNASASGRLVFKARLTLVA
jgi:hypothetical protein